MKNLVAKAENTSVRQGYKKKLFNNCVRAEAVTKKKLKNGRNKVKNHEKMPAEVQCR